MIFYYYYLDAAPLHWECCFPSVEEYKQLIIDKYQRKSLYFQTLAGELENIILHVDEMVDAAMLALSDTVSTEHVMLRCPPMIFPLPGGDNKGSAIFAIVLKMDRDGDTFIYSPVPLPYLDEYKVFHAVNTKNPPVTH